MAVAEEHIKTVLPFVVMPLAARIVLVAVGPPGPVAADDLVRRTAGNFGRRHRRSLGRARAGFRIAHDMFHPDRFDRPDRQVTVSPALVASADAFRK